MWLNSSLFFSRPEKAKEGESDESDGSISMLMTAPVAMETEVHEPAGVEEVRGKSPDEVSIGQHSMTWCQKY